MHRPFSYANVAATLALFVALGGTSYAAVTLAPASVKAKHLAAGAVTTAKVKNGSLKAADFASGHLPAGARGATGPQVGGAASGIGWDLGLRNRHTADVTGFGYVVCTDGA